MIGLVLTLIVLACCFGLVVGVLVLAEPTPEQRRKAEQDRGLDVGRRIR